MKKTRRIICAILCVSLFTCIAYGATGFSDVDKNPNYWATADIQAAAQKGIIDGYELKNGTREFRPENPVKLQESFTMLYRTLKAAGSLKSSEDFSGAHTAELKADVIASWANQYMAYGYEYGLISDSDITKGGAAQAPRLTIAKWACTAMGYQLCPLNVIPYSDCASADTAMYPYVDALYRVGIMQGSEVKGELLFKPANGVKRSEMAAVCNRMLSIKEPRNLAYCLVYESGKLSGFNSSKRTFKIGSKLCRIGAQTEIVIDGESAGFQALAALSGKEAVISCVIGGEDSVIVQTHPAVISAECVLEKKMQDFTILDFVVDGVELSYCVSSSTDGPAEYTAGGEYRFIADGAELIEVR